ncbi:pyrimidine 5'-nucleotidase [Phenylobacterium sp.]|uniref:pyrimidine 5'-nucleotidase n=1 Tax=Phenylobacterium sp. TaxID=1871053 RepID=UPI00391D41BF
MNAAPTSPDLRHVDTWLFDLDNTLYPAESGFMAEITSRMTDFVQKVTGLPREAAHALQKAYLAEHGLTLKGMMLNHGVDPLEFHAIFHDLSLEALAHDPELLAGLARLPGRRLIFTNADDVHARRVLERLELSHLFDDVFHIGSAGYEPKPSPEAFARIGAAHAVDPAVTAFFEDSQRNLEPAAALGMTTVLVGPHAPTAEAPFVHHRTEKLAPFLLGAHVKGAA